MFTEILSDTSGQAALSRFATTNTWNAQQIFKGSATTTPGAVFQAFGTTSAVPAIDPNGIAIFQGAEATAGHVQFSASGATTHLVFRRNNGTYASQTALASGDVIGSLQWQGRGTSTFGTVPAAQIRAVALQTFTETARGTSLEFYTTVSGTITQQLTFSVEPGLVYSLVPLQGTGSATTTAGIIARSNGTISASPAGYGGSNIAGQFLAAESSAFGYTIFESAGNAVGHAVAFRSSRGTYSARTACLSGDMLGQVDFGGYTGAGTFLNGKGAIRCITSEAWSTTATGTQLEFYTTANTTLTSTLRLTISNAGKAIFASNAINITTAQSPATSAAAGTTGDIAWDDTYLYVRMSTGWRRIALGAAF